MSGRERWVQDEFYRIIANITKDRRFAGKKLKVVTEYPVGKRRADVVILKEPEEIPILVIETKSKVERRGRWKVKEKFDPYGKHVIAQALSYAALIKELHNLPVTPLFATANRDVLVLFGPIDDPWKFLNKKAVDDGDYENALKPDDYVHLIHDYYIFDERNPVREDFLERLLDIVAKLWQREVAPEQIRKPFGEWLIGKLRYFVDYLSSNYVEAPLRLKLQKDTKFASDLNDLAQKAGYKNGLIDIVGEDLSRTHILARMMTYVLMNKIIFYKVLERYYNLPELMPILRENPNISSKEYIEKLKEFFEKAVQVTGDFEQIFYTGLFDNIVLSDEIDAMIEIDRLIDLLSEVEIEQFGDVVGYVYEDLIPAEERHQMGQFYTPPPIAELIVKWCVRSPDDRVLDPGCGSGTFLIQAYWRLVELKTGKRRIPSKDVHIKVLRQLYAIDINPFPAQLTAMNLAMKNVRAPTTEAKIVCADFFTVIPGQKILSPHPIITPEGPKYREIEFPKEGFDAVVGNPPYTRWVEIPENVQNNIKEKLGHVLTKYNLHADVARGREPGIYMHFIMWAYEFLKPGGRLGMIISDSWLQTDYGIDFGRYLLENFKVKAVIDISARVFPVPLIGTCIILLEKPRENENVDDNEVVFMYLNIPSGRVLNIDEILKILENPEEPPSYYIVRVMRQGNIPRDQKWINFIFGPKEILDELEEKTIKMGDLFDPSFGNAVYLYLSSIGKVRGPRNLGAKTFFYLDEKKVREYNLHKYAYPAITNARHAKWFTYTREDWEKIRKNGAQCYIFMCHEPKDKLPENVKKYIEWGEPVCPYCKSTNIQFDESVSNFRCQDCGRIFEKCVTQIRKTRGGGKICSQAVACQVREEQKDYFYGWYDLGGVKEAPIMAISQARFKTRFFWCKYNVVTYDRIITFIPKVKLNDLQLKALLAYLNSSFVQLFIETRGRTTGAVGPIALEVSIAREIPIINPKVLDEDVLKELAALFDKLEQRARELGGADKRENILQLWDTVIAEIDTKVAEILELPEALADMARELAKMMMERRLARAGKARPSALRGTKEPLIKIKTRKKRNNNGRSDKRNKRLTEFF